jgi:hypothetical protein
MAVEMSLRVTPDEMTALEKLYADCTCPDGSFDEKGASEGIREIFGPELLAFLCAGIDQGDRRTVKVRVKAAPLR